jgi:hypothetical protein
MPMLRALDERLQYGPAMRVQRVAEAAFLVAAFFTGDVRWAYVTFAFTVLQAVSPRLVPVGLVVAALVPRRAEHALGDLYFDFAGTRGACAISVFVQAGGIALVRGGHPALGFLILAIPAASFVLAPSVGFCCGCAVYVGLRGLFARLGWVKRYANGACDVDVDRAKAAHGH